MDIYELMEVTKKLGLVKYIFDTPDQACAFVDNVHNSKVIMDGNKPTCAALSTCSGLILQEYLESTAYVEGGCEPKFEQPTEFDLNYWNEEEL